MIHLETMYTYYLSYLSYLIVLIYRPFCFGIRLKIFYSTTIFRILFSTHFILYCRAYILCQYQVVFCAERNDNNETFVQNLQIQTCVTWKLFSAYSYYAVKTDGDGTSAEEASVS